MQHQTDIAASVALKSTYAISASLIVNDIFRFFDQHTWVYGAILGTLGYITTFVFQYKTYRLKVTGRYVEPADKPSRFNLLLKYSKRNGG